MTTDDLPGEPVLHALTAAALDNAERLAQDATTLLGADAAPTAHALAVLALEEVGKAVACQRLGGDGEAAQTRAKFMRELGSHESKLQRVRNLMDLLDAMIATFAAGDAIGTGEREEDYRDRLIKTAKADHARKLRGFYVDLSDDDRILVPGEVTRDEAEETIALAKATADVCRSLFLGDGHDVDLPPIELA